MYVDLIVWGIVFAVMVVAELLSMQLVSIWFAAGAAAAFVVSFFDVELWVQLIVFVAVSVLLLVATRPILKKFRVDNTQPTNMELDIGKTAVVIEEINNSIDKGRVRLSGVDWKAVSEDDTVIAKDSIVRVSEVKGSKLIVMLCKEKINN